MSIKLCFPPKKNFFLEEDVGRTDCQRFAVGLPGCVCATDKIIQDGISECHIALLRKWIYVCFFLVLNTVVSVVIQSL